MGIIRFLIGAIIIMLILLVIVPRTTKDKEVEKKAIRIISSICLVLGVSLGISIYYFRDVLLSDPPSNNPTLIAIQTNHPSAKHLLLSSYLVKNFSANDLKQALQQNTNLEELVLREIPAPMVAATLTALQRHPNIRTLEAKGLSSEALQTLMKHWQALPVRKFILKGYAFGDDICSFAANSLTQTNINHLVLEKNLITDNASQHLATLLNNNPQLISISLKENQLNDQLSNDFGDAIARLKSLKELDLSLNQLGKKGIEVLSPSLQSTTQLRMLNLSYNQLDDEALITLAEILKHQNTIEHLELQRNHYSDQGAKAIAEALKANHTLKYIAIRSKLMTSQGEQLLKETLSHFPERTIELGLTTVEKNGVQP